jgi:GH15 family glucan-1,4-alpha-glucosidase
VAGFKPIRRFQGYLPIEDHGLIGDRTAAALVSPDGLAGHEGAFLLCSCWMVDNLAQQNRTGEALELYRSLCARAGTLGLLPEEIDPNTGAFLGNYPQAFSHIGVISSGVNLARLLRKQAAR